MPQQHNPSSGLKKTEQGFTLIELSIVLVIIGLIVGGVLVGQDLIRAAEVRATISQIEKYNTAVNTFRGKYNALPGDINSATATAFGFTARGTSAGQGDGNGVIEGWSAAGTNNGFSQDGENLSFWSDLSVGNTGSGSAMNINLVDGSFSTYTNPSTAAVAFSPSGTGTAAISNYLPAAKLGRGNYVYVYSTSGTNYFGIAPITVAVTTGYATVTPSMTVQQAYNIDKKVDDGFPATGNVMASAGTATSENASAPMVNGSATDSAASCYNTASGTYSLNQNNGNGANCALSFRFQ